MEMCPEVTSQTIVLNHRMLWQAVVAAGEASTRLVVLPGFLIIALHELLHAIDDGV